MLDIFKKEEINSLKARIRELEEGNRILSLQAGKKEDKTRKTVAARQVVERELNEAKNQILSLENEIVKLKKDAKGELNFRFSENLSKNRLDDILFLLGTIQSRTSTLISIYLAGNENLDDVPHDIRDHIESGERVLIEKIESNTGKAVFYDTDRIIKLVLLPVFPILESEYSLRRDFDLEPLKKIHSSDKILVINAHAGETFIGIIENDTFIEHDIIRSSVMGKHSKGGWSQKRFQSLVEEDIKHHADKVRTALHPMIGKHGDIQHVIAGGESKLIKMIIEGYDLPLIFKSLEAVSAPQQVLRDVMSVRMYGI